MPLRGVNQLMDKAESLMDQDYQLIETPEALAQLVAELIQLDCVGLDTEFVRTQTFYAQLGLVQVFDGQNTYLIDCVAIEDISAFADLLDCGSCVKIFHAPGEDLEILLGRAGTVTAPIFDTQRAAGLIGMDPSLSLQAMVDQLLGEQLDKGESRSDWIARPLSSSQLHYAAEDVRCLFKLYKILGDKLEQYERLDSLYADTDRHMQVVVESATLLERYYLRVGMASRMDRRQLARLQALSKWRERLARELDVPRNRTISDKALVDIVMLSQFSYKTLSQLDELHPRALKKYGDKILDVLAQVDALPEPALPKRLARPLSKAHSANLKALKAYIAERAETLSIAPTLLLRKADMTLIMQSYDDNEGYSWPPQLNDWRGDLLRGDLLDYLNGLPKPNL